MKLNTGKVAIPIEFDTGDVENIYFNPNDLDFAVRLKKMMANLEQYAENIQDIELDENGNPTNDSFLEQFAEVKEKLMQEIDGAFKSEVSKVVFKHGSPFALINDEYFVTQFFKALSPVVQQHIEKATKESAKRKNKHIGKYVK